MATELKSIENIFPLIDDPMNIFYSKIKQWFRLNSNFHLHCRATSRVDREIDCSFNGITRLYKCKFKTFNLLKEEDIGHYLYVRYTFILPSKTTTEMTTSGETIPVDISDIYILEDSPKPVVLHDHSENILYTENLGDYDKPHYYVYIRVNKIYKTKYSQIDVENTEKDYTELHFEDAYRQTVGRLWVLANPTQYDVYCDLDEQCTWVLYNIDSDNNYRVMDKSNTKASDLGCSWIWPIQYGVGIDHRATIATKYGSGNTHPFISVENNQFWVEIREIEWADGYSSNVIAKLLEGSEPYLNTRGQVPAFFKYLFKYLHFNIKTPSAYRHSVFDNLCGEAVILTISYICNMNIRYLLCPFTIGQNSNIGKPLSYILSKAIPMNNESGCTIEDVLNKNLNSFDDYFLGSVIKKTISSPGATVTINYTKNNSSQNILKNNLFSLCTDTQHSYYSQNDLFSNYYPNTRWYIRQFVYAMQFLRYNNNISFQYGACSIGGQDPIECKFFTTQQQISYLRSTLMNRR